MSIGDASEGVPQSREQPARPRRTYRSPRWSKVRLAALWTPIATVLALGLWDVLFLTLDPWGYNWWNSGPQWPDALPSQLLFAVVLLVAGRYETATRGGTQPLPATARAYWKLTAWLVVIAVVALEEMALSQPVLQ